MSKATKRKYVTKEVLDEFCLPDETHSVVKVIASKGNNLHEIETPNNDRFLVSMPTKFRKNVWIKRGDYVLVTPIEEGDKVKAEISHILYKEQIKYIQDEHLWPEGFATNIKVEDENTIPADMLPPSSDDEDSENEMDMCNPNRPTVYYSDSEEESSDNDECANAT